jgi:hypothetical protein
MSCRRSALFLCGLLGIVAAPVVTALAPLVERASGRDSPGESCSAHNGQISLRRRGYRDSNAGPFSSGGGTGERGKGREQHRASTKFHSGGADKHDSSGVRSRRRV